MIQFLVCVLAAGCVTAKVHRLDQDVRPARTPDAIETLAEAPDRPYAVIARIESKSDAAFDSFDDLRTRMIAEAAELGGDALVLGPESTESDFVILPTGFLVKSDRKKLAGEVIVFD